jgi:DNA-directed RNA polymerase specialized sigma24 family protein
VGLDEHTKMGGDQVRFLTTRWTLIENVADNDKDEDRALIGILLKRYWKPVYCYLRRLGYGNEEAKDLTQAFFHDVVQSRRLFQRADKSLGRFRSFLLVALKRYVTNVRDKEFARKRIQKSKLVPLDMVDESGFSALRTELTPEDSYQYVWVSSLLEQVLEHVKNDCYKDGKVSHWHVFRERVLGPIIDKTDPPAMDVLCSKYGIKDHPTASNMIVTVKRRFHMALINRLRNLVSSDEEVNAELEEIMQFLPRIAQDHI